MDKLSPFSLVNGSRFAQMLLAFCLLMVPVHAKFQQTAGPGGGHVNAFAVAGGDFYVGTFSGVYRSTDQGRNWKAAGLADYEITTLASIGNLVLAGTNEHGVFRTGDAGKTWTQPGISGSTVTTLAIFNGLVFRGNNGGSITASSDSGATTEQWMKGLPPSGNQYYVQEIAGKLYAYVDNLGIYTLSVPDSTWSLAWSWKPDSPHPPSPIRALAVTDSEMFIGTSHDGMFRLGKNDTMPTQIAKGLMGTASIRSLTARGAALFLCTDTATYHSIDHGNTWSRIGSLIPVAVDAGGFFEEGGDLYLGSSIGLLRLAATGDSWTPLNAGLAATNVTSFASMGADLFAGTMGDGVARTSDAGATWTPVNLGLAELSVYCLLAVGETLWAGTRSGIYRSADRGANWIRLEQAPSRRVLSLIESGGYIVAGTDFGAYRTVDGTDWTGPGAGIPSSNGVTALAKNDSGLFAIGDSRFYRSSDDGASWIGPSNGSGLSEPLNSLFAVGNDVYGGKGESGILYHSSDNGRTWPKSGYGKYSGGYIYSWASNGTLVFAGTGHGMIDVAPVGAGVWSKFGDSLSYGTSTQALAIADGIVFAGTKLGGVWKRPLAEVTALPPSPPPGNPAASRSISIPEGFLAPECRVNFAIPRPGWAALALYDTRGRKAASLFEGEIHAGGHQATFRSNGLPAGIYFLRLRAPGLDQNRRVVLGKPGA